MAEQKLRPYSDYVSAIKADPTLQSYTVKGVKKSRYSYKLDLLKANKQVCKKQTDADFEMHLKTDKAKPDIGTLVLIKFGTDKISVKFYSQTGKFLFGE